MCIINIYERKLSFIQNLCAIKTSCGKNLIKVIPTEKTMFIYFEYFLCAKCRYLLHHNEIIE